MSQPNFDWRNSFGEAVADQVNAWQLKDWEAGILWRVMTVAGIGEMTPSDALDQCQNFKSIMRGEKPDLPAFTASELSGLTIDDQLLSDANFTCRVLRTVYLAINFGDVNLAGILREKIEVASGGDLSFASLSEEDQKAYYQNLYLELCFAFVVSLPEKNQLFVLSSELFPMAVHLRYPIADWLSDYIDTFANFERRIDMSLNYATFLIINDTSVGERNGEPVPLMKWFELFRTYSKETLGAMELMKFLDDDAYAGQCTESEKEIIRNLIELYVQLVSGALAVPNRDLDAIEAEALRLVKNSRQSGPNWYYIINSPVVGGNQRAEIRDYLANESNSVETARTIKKAVERILDWNTGVKLDNILMINDLYEQHFGPSAEPLVYFDEASGKFVLNTK